MASPASSATGGCKRGGGRRPKVRARARARTGSLDLIAAGQGLRRNLVRTALVLRTMAKKSASRLERMRLGHADTARVHSVDRGLIASLKARNAYMSEVNKDELRWVRCFRQLRRAICMTLYYHGAISSSFFFFGGAGMGYLGLSRHARQE
jgi:hypothetical protein